MKIKYEEETFPCLSQTGEGASSFLTQAQGLLGALRGFPVHPLDLLRSAPSVLSGTLVPPSWAPLGHPVCPSRRGEGRREEEEEEETYCAHSCFLLR